MIGKTNAQDPDSLGKLHNWRGWNPVMSSKESLVDAKGENVNGFVNFVIIDELHKLAIIFCKR